MKQTIISGKDVCKSFANNGGQNHVLDMINVDIQEEDFTIIMGSSGAGKSTLLYALSGMDHLTSGQVFYKEKEISAFKEKDMTKLRSNEFGFVFQQTHLVSNLTLFENVAATGSIKKLQLLQNVIAILAGMIIGIPVSIQVIKLINSITITTSGLLIPSILPLGLCLLSLAVIILLLISFIVLKTRKVDLRNSSAYHFIFHD